MEKKGATLLLVFAFVILMEATVASASADVAYIYRKEFKIDNNILKIFNESNLTYNLIDERNLPVNFAQYKLIYVGDEDFRYPNRILVNQFPSIIANSYDTNFWGLTDADGASQLGASHPLSVLKDGKMIQVYTQAREFPGGPAVIYYFLDSNNKAPGIQTIALTEPTQSGEMFGDVIANAPAGTKLFEGRTQQAKLCFFGLTESKYWTPAGKALFQQCLGYVRAECEVDSDCPGPESSPGFCQSGDVYRNVTIHTCQAVNAIKTCVSNQTTELVEDCPFNCQNGQCTGECKNDSDCGISGPIDGLFCLGKNITQMFEQFTCVNPNTPQSHCTATITNQTKETCKDSCINGICQNITCFTNSDCNDLNSSTEDICHNPGTVQSFCTNEPIACFNNSDCGIDGFKGDPFCLGANVTKLFESFICKNPGTAASFCNSTQEQRTIQKCADACVSGACKGIKCFKDSDCNDQNSSTLDQCINPGTVSSECRNTPINCASDADCGFTGFLGQEFCSGTNIVKTFQNATCSNDGTLQSFCTVTQENKILEHCSQICANGHCLNSACNSDADCNDSNPLTFDQCIDPGTASSECRNTPINCASNINCGFTGFVGNEYCSSDRNVSKNFQTATCINPGQLSSHCDLSVAQQFLNQCDFSCSNGTCVRCDSNADCNDGNTLTVDTCHNPGTSQSFCTNEPSTNVTACSKDSDCGINAPLSPLFCSGLNVSQLVQTWNCNNPGTSQSFCSSSTIINLVTSCPRFCTNGECVDIRCFTNSDCDDSNSHTVDICINPGTPQSNCTNNPFEITCSKDSDCGIDGFVDGPFCLANNVTKLFQQFDCNLPGTPQSYCSTSISEIMTEQCTHLCVNGQCVPEQGECTPGQIRSCGTDVGECRAGINVCFTNAAWSNECFGEISPTTEICDGLDNNCNGQVDEGGVCGNGCTNECTLGNKRCNGNGFQLCGNFDSDSCSEWSAISTCSPTEICTEGSCIPGEPSCQDECVLGSRDCSGNGFRLCGNFDADSCSEWSLPASCSSTETCTNGFCVPNEPSCQNDCVAGQRRCNGNGYQLCANFDADPCVEWSLPTSCGSTKICTEGYCS